MVDTSQLITAVAVLPGNAPDNRAGTGGTERGQHRRAGAGGHGRRRLWGRSYQADLRRCGPQAGSPVPGRPDRKHFPKDDFVIDLAAGSCTCPAGQVTHTIVPAGKRTDAAGRVYRWQAFQFDGAECRTCPLRSQCIAAKGRKGRRVLIHPQEGLLQEARALQQSAAYDEYRARPWRWNTGWPDWCSWASASPAISAGSRRDSSCLAATVANLTLVAGKSGLSDSVGGGAEAHRAVLSAVPVMSRLFPTVLSPMLRPFSARSGSEYCGP